MRTWQDVIRGDARWSCEAADAVAFLRGLPDGCVHCCVTSPPYYALRDYGVDGQIGLEDTPAAYVERLVVVFREVRRVLHRSGVFWLNVGDSFCSTAPGTRNAPQWKGSRDYADEWANYRPETPPGCKPKDLLGIPWLLAFALRADGWYLRQECPWVKRNPMPESVDDRPSTACEKVFLFSKSSDYFFDMEAVKRTPLTNLPVVNKPRSQNRAPGRGDLADRPKDGWGSLPSDPNGRNFRSADLWFDSVGMLLADDGETLLGFDVNPTPYKGAHFAVMPPKLVEPCILAGSSEAGVCKACGEPRRRVVEKGKKFSAPDWNRKIGTDFEFTHRTRPKGNGPLWAKHKAENPDRTVGWEPGCECGVGVVPAIVLDPFAGSGTVLSVALNHGRRAIGCDLNPKYVELARKRMRKVTPPLFEVATP